MKKLIICLVFVFVTGCYFEDPSIMGGDYCIYDVYQNATVIDQECKNCDIGDYDGDSVYYINTAVTCTP